MKVFLRITVLLFLIFTLIIILRNQEVTAQSSSPVMLKDIYPFPNDTTFPYNFVFVQDKLYFIAFDGISSSVWESDGTESGTKIFDSPSPTYLTKFNDLLLIFGNGFWYSDGTESGTHLVKSLRLYRREVIRVGNVIYFQTENESYSSIVLWKSDLTSEGTVVVKSDLDPGLTKNSMIEFQNHLYFISQTDNNKPAIWKSDGTEEGTEIVMEWDYLTHPCPPLELFYATNDLLYFGVAEFCYGVESEDSAFSLWRTDGTESGTFQLLYNWYMASAEFTHINGKVLFSFALPYGGRAALHSSDGTVNGTIRIGDTSANGFARVNGDIFLGGNNGLWKTDGTEEGTILIKEFPSTVGGPVNIAGTLFFAADDGINGRELWQSDGTTTGTIMVSNINPQGSSWPFQLTNGDGFLFFNADDGTNGFELWGMNYIDLDFSTYLPTIYQQSP